jgi:hypothetical protein
MSDVPPYQEIAEGIRARHLETPLYHVTSFEVGTSEQDAASSLRELGFDQAPVTRDGSLIGYVFSEELDAASSEQVDTKLRPLAPEHIVSGESSLGPTLRWLAERRLLFVLGGNSITGLMTPADLNKQAGRTYFFLLLAELELALSELIRSRFRDQSHALAALGETRQDGVRERIADDRKRNIDADLVACLTFADVCEIAEYDAGMRSILGFDSKKRMAKRLGPIKRLRDDVMHPVRALLTPERSIDVLAELDVVLRGLVTKAAEPSVGTRV